MPKTEKVAFFSNYALKSKKEMQYLAYMKKKSYLCIQISEYESIASFHRWHHLYGA